MITGEPRIVEIDGQRQLVDATGATLVCRRRSPYVQDCFHKVDLDRFDRDGTIRPRCEHVMGGQDDRWVLRRRRSFTDAWDGCQYHGCYGEEPIATGETGPHLATTLKDMSPEKFETTVTDHRASANEGEQV